MEDLTLFDISLFNDFLTVTQINRAKKILDVSKNIVSFLDRVTVLSRFGGSASKNCPISVCYKIIDRLLDLGLVVRGKGQQIFFNSRQVCSYRVTPLYTTFFQQDPNIIRKAINATIERRLPKSLLPLSAKHPEVIKKYHLLKKGAVSRQKEFKLSLTDVKNLLNRKTCYYTGCKFSDIADSNTCKTIDRINPNKGYVRGNVVACTKIANSLKNTVLENGSCSLLGTKELTIMFEKFLKLSEEKGNEKHQG